jgi:hypothetical protein
MLKSALFGHLIRNSTSVTPFFRAPRNDVIHTWTRLAYLVLLPLRNMLCGLLEMQCSNVLKAISDHHQQTCPRYLANSKKTHIIGEQSE